MRLEFKRKNPKHHPNWWFGYGPSTHSEYFSYEKFEKIFFKHFKHARIEIYDRHIAPTAISITFENEEDNARFIMLMSAEVFYQ